VSEIVLDFRLEGIRDAARKFAKEEILKAERAYDKNPTLPRDIFRKGIEAGIMLGMIPKEYGGRGYSSRERFIIAEECAFACAGITISMQVQDACIIPILKLGNKEQKKFYFSEMLNDKIFSMAYTEPGCGSDLSAITTIAKKSGDKYILNGKKSLIAAVQYCDYVEIFAKIEGTNNFAMFVIDMKSEGVTVTKEYRTMGQRANELGDVEFVNVVVDECTRLGEEQNMKRFLEIIENNRACCAAVAIGLGHRAMDEAAKYAINRKAFGRKICDFQSIGHNIAQMDIKLQAARLLGYQAIKQFEECGSDSNKLASYAKAFASESAMQICVDAVQIFGGYGVIEDNIVEKLYRDVKSCQIYEGTTQIQYDIISRKLLKEYERKYSGV
jgi:acyl-CoA dehydrogenase